MTDTRIDWFVAAGTLSGNGSRENPFHDPWLALRAAGPGDVIHIAAGTYFGRYDRSSWVVDCPNLTLMGGYSRDFARRAPWQTPSVFAVFEGYEGVRENNLISGRSDHSGLILDGLFFDAAGRNTYFDKPGNGIQAYSSMDGAIASFNAKQVTIRNCIFANSAQGAVELSGEGSRFENNLVINTIGIGMLNLRNRASTGGEPITVTNCGFCFAHDVGPPCGTGGDQAIGIRVNGPAVVQDNVFVSCGNAAISAYQDLGRVSIDRNIFYMSPRAVLNSHAQGNTGEVTEQSIEELEDLGFKSATGNAVQDPGTKGLNKEWVDSYSRHLLSNYVKPPREAANSVRCAYGLPTIGQADLENEENKGVFAPRFAVEDALALSFGVKQGCNPAELSVDILGRPSLAIADYRRIDWLSIDQPDPALANQTVELRVGLGFEQNTSLLDGISPETHMSFRVCRPGSDEGSLYVLARRYTLPTRQFEEAIKYNNGREAEDFYLLRGVYRTDVASSRQRVTLLVDSIVPAPQVETNFVRPVGRDWFVRAGASGGDGSREKPFRDPFQALEKAEGGDSIHVATGDYFGKLRSGHWKIVIRNLTLLGGYDADFSNRDPWKNPTRFLLNPEERAKGTPEGTVLASAENSEGLVLDGFIFDGATYNAYSASGGLDLRNSPRDPLVQLGGGRAPIAVRNCLFINASGAGINVSCPYGVFENNIIVNVSGWSLEIRADGPGPWSIRNNTVLFASNPTQRAGTSQSSSDGCLFLLSGRATVSAESNIFAFADNFGIRATVPQQNLTFNNNVLSAALYMYFTDVQYLWADASNFERRAAIDSGFASFEGNSLELPKLPVDAKFADAALTRLFEIPSRVSANQWETLAAQVGASVRPASPHGAAEELKPVAEAVKPASAPTSLNDILSSLSSMKDQMKEIDSHKAASAAPEPVYCPIYDWKKALELAQDGADGPGAHRRELAVSFAKLQEQAAVEYTPITAQVIDADHALLEAKSVELEVTETRSSPWNPSNFPTGTTGDDYASYSVSTFAEATRRRISLIVRLDTAASKTLDRTVSADKLRIRGTARIPGNPNVLSIVVDSVELISN